MSSKRDTAGDLFAAMRDVFFGVVRTKTKVPRAAPTMTAAKAKPLAGAAAKPTTKALRAGLDKSVTRASTEGEIRRDEAIDRVERHADPAWMKRAHEVVRRVAMRKPFFTTDDVWSAGLIAPFEPRALGPVMQACEKLGLINATREFRPTTRASHHCAPVRVWRSLLIPIDIGKVAAS